MELIQPDKLAHFSVQILSPDSSELQNIEALLVRLGISFKLTTSAHELLSNITSPTCGCVLLDVRLPFYSSTELQQILHKQDAGLPIIFMGQENDIKAAIKVLKAGAFDFLVKPLDEQHLLEVISLALRKRQEQLSLQDFLKKIEKLLLLLSLRENEVLQHMLQGLPNKEIGLALQISTKTVEQHRANIMRKMQVGSLAELVSSVTHYRIKKAA